MATWQKSDPGLVRRFEENLPLAADVERRKMFGYPCAFVNGNMFAGLHEQRLVVRWPAQAADHPFRPMGRTMTGYAALEDALEAPAAQFRDWIAQALAYTRSLPPKAKKKAVKAAAPASSRPARRAPKAP